MSAAIVAIGGGGFLMDGEAWRQPILVRASLRPAYGAPDGVMLRFDDGRCREAVTDRPGLAAVEVNSSRELVPISTRLLTEAA